MNNFEDFRTTAILLIYPNATIENIQVNEQLLHMAYFIDLYKHKSMFKEALSKTDYVLPKRMVESNNASTYILDVNLAKLGIITFHNLFIDEVNNDPDYIKRWPPEFFVNMPRELTDEQIDLMQDLFSKYDMSCSLYGTIDKNEEELIDISYDDALSMINKKIIK